jgi:hypothetical protein
MVKAVKGPTTGIREFCMACMDGRYPTGDVTPDVLRSIESERNREARRAAKDRRAAPRNGAAAAGEGTELDAVGFAGNRRPR